MTPDRKTKPDHPADEPPAIVFEHVSVSRGGREIVAAVDRSLAERRVAVVGPNGSGKSTLLRLVNGLARPSAGCVRVGGLDPAREPLAVRRRVGFVFQNPDNQIVYPVVEEDLVFGLRNLGLSRRAALDKVRETVSEHGLGSLKDASVYTLSGGEKQLVALLGVLIMNPAIVLLDEPTTMLDLRHRNRMAAEIASLDAMVVLATHDLDLVADFDRVLVMDGGRIVADDVPAAAIRWYRTHLS